MSKTTLASMFALSLLAGTLCPMDARADVPPPDSCTTAGQPCKTAGDKLDQAGTCTAMKCKKMLPSKGGLNAIEYDCNKCVATAGAAAASGAKPASAATSASAAPAPAPAAPVDGSKTGCSVSAQLGSGSSGGFAAACALVAACALLGGRRRPTRP